MFYVKSPGLHLIANLILALVFYMAGYLIAKDSGAICALAILLGMASDQIWRLKNKCL